MAGLRKRQRINLIILGFACIGLAFAAVYYAAGDALQYYYGPTELAEKDIREGRVIRVGGLVEEGSVVLDGEVVHFAITDGTSRIKVRYTGIRPDLFREGQGTIATGVLQGDLFVASQILAKHDENYIPREVVETLKEQGVYQEPDS